MGCCGLRRSPEIDLRRIKNKLKEMSISDYCFDSLKYWGSFSDSYELGPTFINGGELGRDQHDLSPIFNLGLTGYDNSQYI